MTAGGLLTARRLRPSAQSCRRGYPGITNEIIIQPQGGCGISSAHQHGATALRLGLKPLLTQGSRSGNPGLEGATALRFGGESNRVYGEFRKYFAFRSLLPPLSLRKVNLLKRHFYRIARTSFELE